MKATFTAEADFRGPEGDLYRVTPKDIGEVRDDVPEWIRGTLLFKWLLMEGKVLVEDQDEKPVDESKPEPVETKAPVAVETEIAPKRKSRKQAQ